MNISATFLGMVDTNNADLSQSFTGQLARDAQKLSFKDAASAFGDLSRWVEDVYERTRSKMDKDYAGYLVIASYQYTSYPNYGKPLADFLAAHPWVPNDYTVFIPIKYDIYFGGSFQFTKYAAISPAFSFNKKSGEYYRPEPPTAFDADDFAIQNATLRGLELRYRALMNLIPVYSSAAAGNSAAISQIAGFQLLPRPTPDNFYVEASDASNPIDFAYIIAQNPISAAIELVTAVPYTASGAKVLPKVTTIQKPAIVLPSYDISAGAEEYKDMKITDTDISAPVEKTLLQKYGALAAVAAAIYYSVK